MPSAVIKVKDAPNDVRVPFQIAGYTIKPRVRFISHYTYAVQSESDPTMGYIVNTLNLTCRCEAGKHGKRCKHLLSALYVENYRRTHGLDV